MRSYQELLSEIKELKSVLEKERRRELANALEYCQLIAGKLNLEVKLVKKPFNSAAYWEQRYKNSGDSGAGSYGRLAHFKADTVNEIVKSYDINSVVEFGCGDGNQLRLAKYPNYLGYDVSTTIVKTCQQIFKDDDSKKFKLLSDFKHQKFDLSLSLDVIYHLIEDDVYHDYMRKLFSSSHRLVMIYSSNTEDKSNSTHVRHREFVPWVHQNFGEFKLVEKIKNPYPFDDTNPNDTSFAEFFVFKVS